MTRKHQNPCAAPMSMWRVWHRRCNYSAFNGYACTPSDYSRMLCLACGWPWRTKAAYVDSTPDATQEEIVGAGRLPKWRKLAGR